MARHEPDRIAELLAITDPLEGFAAITAYGRDIGNLPPVLAKKRKANLAKLRSRLSAGQIVTRAPLLARSGIFRLTRLTAPEGAQP